MLRVLLLAIGVIVVVSLLPVESTQPSAYADPAFSRYQRRAGQQGRAMLWGGDPLLAIVESYIGAPGDRRLVEYYERGRMEIDNTVAGGVTEGLLVREMVSGNVQQGDDVVVQEHPADLPILVEASAGRADIPTYADFSDLTWPVAESSADTYFNTWIDSEGNLSQSDAPVNIAAERFVEETGHTVPDVFVSWEQSMPFGDIDPQQALGFPITEPYWVTTGLGENGVSLVQLYERRVVVYTPDLPAGEQFRLTSTGRHYYRWRYGVDPVPAQSNEKRSLVPAVVDDDGLTLPENFHVTALPIDVTGIVDIAVAPTGDLALAYDDGTIQLATAEGKLDSDDPFIEGLNAPVGIAFSGADLFVLDADGLHRFQDTDGDRDVDDERIVLSDQFVPETVELAAGPNRSLFVSGVRLTAPKLGRTSTITTSSLLRVEADGAVTELPNSAALAGKSFLADDEHTLWLFDADNQMKTLDLVTDELTLMLETSALDASTDPVDLLMYRPDGASGDPRQDLLALVTGDHSGRIIRVRPAVQEADSGERAGTPNSTPQPGAVVDFVTGFQRPSAMSAGLDGSLYVVDAAKGSIFRIQPN